jgi:hypothetical protein
MPKSNSVVLAVAMALATTWLSRTAEPAIFSDR